MLDMQATKPSQSTVSSKLEQIFQCSSLAMLRKVSRRFQKRERTIHMLPWEGWTPRSSKSEIFSRSLSLDPDCSSTTVISAPQLVFTIDSRCTQGLKPPRGILLHGPPGTGKTHLARAIAASTAAAVLIVNGPELSGAFHGETEGRLRAVFAEARAKVRSLLLFPFILLIEVYRVRASWFSTS
jgi:transcriptional regulator with AAA-type ATPase domain